MELGQGSDYIAFWNVRLLPQPSLFAWGFWGSVGLCGTTWDSALLFFGRLVDNLVLFQNNGTTERLTVNRPTATLRSSTNEGSEEDPIEDSDEDPIG